MVHIPRWRPDNVQSMRIIYAKSRPTMQAIVYGLVVVSTSMVCVNNLYMNSTTFSPPPPPPIDVRLIKPADNIDSDTGTVKSYKYIEQHILWDGTIW